MKTKKIKSPYLMILLSFAGVILVGTLLLALPISHQNGQSLSIIDAFFVSTSAVCVTGLSPVDISVTLSFFGKLILTLLIEIGGLGFVTVVMFIIIILGIKVDINNRVLLKEALNHQSMSGLVKLVRNIILTTLAIQAVGAVINFIVFIQDFSFWDAAGLSIFHSISSFNNAGFDLLGNNSLVGYTDNILLNINTSILIILGGIGFMVLFDVFKKKKFSKLTIHSKIVIYTSIFLIFSGAILIKATNWENMEWHQALFISISSRTAGFATVNLGSTLSSAGIIIIIGLMFIGSSPASTGGGIKTTTFYTICKSIESFIKGKKTTIAHNRRIAQNSIIKSYILVIFGLALISIATFLVITAEQIVGHSFTFEQLLFETFSAFGTVGLSLNVTSGLTSFSKIILCFVMFCGRLGPITIMNLWHRNITNDIEENIKYVEERIIIG